MRAVCSPRRCAARVASAHGVRASVSQVTCRGRRAAGVEEGMHFQAWTASCHALLAAVLLVGFVVGAVQAFIFNIAAGLVGGIILETE